MKTRSKATLLLRAMLARGSGLGRAPTSRLCATCGHRGIACHLAAAPKMAQKNRGPYLICTPFTGHPVGGVLLCGTRMSTKGNV